MFDWLFGGNKSKTTTKSTPQSVTPKSTPQASSAWSDDGPNFKGSSGSGSNFGSILTAIAMVGVGIYQANRASKDAKKMADAITNNTVQAPAVPEVAKVEETVVKDVSDRRRKISSQSGMFSMNDNFSNKANLVRKQILGG
jgi:hypothetical protein